MQAGKRNDELWVLLHGWGRSMADFSALCTLLDQSPDSPWVARFDLPGFGASPAPESAGGSHEYAVVIGEAVSEAVSQMPLGERTRVILVGHSFGGRVAITLGPQGLGGADIAGIVLSGVPLLRNEASKARPKRAYRVLRALSRRGLISRGRMEQVRSKFGSQDYRNAEGVMREVLVRVVNESYDDALRAIGVPVNMLWGIDDSTAPISVAERAAGLYPKWLRLQAVPGDHFVAISSPLALMESIEDLVRRTEN